MTACICTPRPDLGKDFWVKNPLCPVHAPETSNGFLADHERRIKALEKSMAELLDARAQEAEDTRQLMLEAIEPRPKGRPMVLGCGGDCPDCGIVPCEPHRAPVDPTPPPVEAEGDDAEKIALAFFPTQHVNQAALEARIIQLAIAIRADERRAAVGAFTNAILHGDRDHRDWLIEAHNAFLTHDTLPAPRGKGAAEAERDALRAKLEAAEIECEHLRKLLEAR